MRRVSKAAYWVAGFLATTAWSAAIIALSGLPLPVQLALAGMALVACVWGHAVLFPRPTATAAAPIARPGRPLPPGRARIPVSRTPRNPAFDLPPGELPTLLREPFEEAARMEAHRLAEAISAAGLFGLVNIRLEAGGTALVAPVRADDSIRLPTATLVALAHRLTREPDESAGPGAGAWPGHGLADAIANHLSAARPPAVAQPASGAADNWAPISPGPLAIRPA